MSLHGGEELLERLLEAVPGAVLHVTRDGTIAFANDEAVRVFGIEVTDQGSITRWAPRCVGEDGEPLSRTQLPASMALVTGEAQGPRTVGVHCPDGRLAWAVVRAVPVNDPARGFDGVIVTMLDITARKHAEEELRRSEQRWRSLAENLPDYVVLADKHGTLLSVNRLTKAQEQHYIGTSVYDHLDPAYRAQYQAKFDEALTTKTRTRLETLGAAATGRLAWYESLLVPLVDEHGDVERVLVVARDITERRAMVASLAEKERLASLGTVAASVAHEIMNPLTYVLANLDYALSERVSDEAKRARALVDAREGAQRMQQIVFDLRSLGRAGEDMTLLDPRRVLESAIRLSNLEIQRSARLVLDFDEVPGVIASESRLCQVFINLLVNAAQALEDRLGADREICVRMRHDESAGAVTVDVSDNGAGIPRDRLPLIFEPFYTTKANGTGLGLSISRELLTRMGGRIAVESTPGAGATFTVWLPTVRPSRAPSLAAV